MTTYESSRRTVGKMFLIFFLRHSQDSEQVRSWFPWTRAHVSESRRVGSVRNLLFPIPGGRLYVRRNTEGRGAGLNTCCATETPSPGGLVSEQAQPEPIVINGCLSPGANLSTGQLPDTHNTRDKDSHLLALTWCQMGWRPTAEPRNQEEAGRKELFFFLPFNGCKRKGTRPKAFEILQNCVSGEIWHSFRLENNGPPLKDVHWISDEPEMVIPLNVLMNAWRTLKQCHNVIT